MFKKQEVSDSLVDAVAKKVARNYADEISQIVNERATQILSQFKEKLVEMDRRIRTVEELNDERLKHYLKILFESHSDHVVEQAVSKSFARLDLESVLVKIKELSGLIERVDELEKNLNSLKDEINSEINKITEEFSEMSKKMNTAVTYFERKVAEATTSAVEQIKENVVIDKSLLIGVFEEVSAKELSKITERIDETVFTFVEKLEQLRSELNSKFNELRSEITSKLSELAEAKPETSIIEEEGYMVEGDSKSLRGEK